MDVLSLGCMFSHSHTFRGQIVDIFIIDLCAMHECFGDSLRQAGPWVGCLRKLRLYARIARVRPEVSYSLLIIRYKYRWIMTHIIFVILPRVWTRGVLQLD